MQCSIKINSQLNDQKQLIEYSFRHVTHWSGNKIIEKVLQINNGFASVPSFDLTLKHTAHRNVFGLNRHQI